MKKYVFKPYNPVFTELFDKEKERINKYLPADYLIEHVGSTAVPDLGGKGIIDIYIIVPENHLKQASNELTKAGYEYRPQASTSGHLFFRIDLPDPIEEIRRYHIHLGAIDSDDFKKAILFRNYLHAHPKDVKKYAVIKKNAAENANQDRDIYMKIKSPFMREILDKALNVLTIKTYNRIAKRYSKKHSDPIFWKKEFLIFKKLIKGRKIIDIGCGAGRGAVLFEQANFDYKGIDASSEMISLARKQIKKGN